MRCRSPRRPPPRRPFLDLSVARAAEADEDVVALRLVEVAEDGKIAGTLEKAVSTVENSIVLFNKRVG